MLMMASGAITALFRRWTADKELRFKLTNELMSTSRIFIRKCCLFQKLYFAFVSNNRFCISVLTYCIVLKLIENICI